MLSIEEGEKLIRYARDVIEKHLKGKKIDELENFEENKGVFVTINTYPENELRGCIGIPEPIMPLKKAIKESAISACHDPRFPDLMENELDRIVIEVTVLTKPILLEVEPEKYAEHIKIGRDGLMVEKGIYRGLLLPQVAVEYGWNVIDFLRYTCIKAGLPENEWKKRDTKVYVFQGEIFSEEKPRGKIKKNA
ncbi:MAG: TIGR00296 family protein [Candidatus Thermoplasmatota archaeon]